MACINVQMVTAALTIMQLLLHQEVKGKNTKHKGTMLHGKEDLPSWRYVVTCCIIAVFLSMQIFPNSFVYMYPLLLLSWQEFKLQHGHCNVPQGYDKNTKLGAWVSRQRLMMRTWDEKHEADKGISCSDSDGNAYSQGDRVQQLKDLGLESFVGKFVSWSL